MKYWPGTNIRKSHNNAFDWRDSKSIFSVDKEIRISNNTKIQMANSVADPKRSFIIYSKAKAKS